MKTKVIIIVAGILLLLNMTCGCGILSGITKPTIGDVPQGWYISADDPYGTYEDWDGTKSGLIAYTDVVDYDFVHIYYGDIPPELKGNEADSNFLIAKAIDQAVTFYPDETGTMVVAGRLAGYAKAYDSVYDWYEMEIVFVYESTCIDIYACYDETSGDEAQVMSLINSISF